MNYITVKEASQKWGIKERRIQVLCSEGRINGACKFGRDWMIPQTAVFPSRNTKKDNPTLPMPKKTPFLDMTNLYNTPGYAKESAEKLINQYEAYSLFNAQIAYRRGDIEHVYEQARYFLKAHSGFYAILGGGMLLAQCAIWRGDIYLWKEAKMHICEAPCKNEHDRELISLALAIIDSSIYDNKDYPEWFKLGNFERIPGDSHPAAKVFYVKYLYMSAYAVATNQFQLEGVKGLALMKMIPNTIEPLISQAVIDKTIIPEIYLRMSCAVAYYNSGMKEYAIYHIDKAITLALPDKLYGLLTEYVRHFGELLYQRIEIQNQDAIKEIKSLFEIYSVGWSRLSSRVKEKYIFTTLNFKEREIVKLSAFGYTVKEIASMMHLSESTISHDITKIMNKTGILTKKEFAYIL